MEYMNNDLPVFTYPGRIELKNTINMIKNILDVLEKDSKGVLISLQKCGSYAKEEDINAFGKSMNELQGSIKIDVALIDYSPALFERIKHIANKNAIKLLNSIDAAVLFLNPKSLNEELKILLYEPDKVACNTIKQALNGSKYKLYIAHDNQSYKNIIQLEKIDITISQTMLTSKEISKNKTTNGLKLSKELVSNLPLFIDTAVETLMTLTALDAEKSKHGIGHFKNNFDDTPLAALMKFSGPFQGTFFLIFPKSIACKTLTAMMGEDVDPEDTEALKDGVGEFCNIITGSIKNKLQGKEFFMTFELPQTYGNIQEISKMVEKEEGIWIDMLLEKDPFYIFISQ